MVAFRTSTDIGNRALQHCGANRMDPILGFSDTSVRGAAEIAFCYDMLREAELTRNTWTFATRRAAIRAIDSNTLLLSPALFTPTTTYFVGSIVADQNGNMWISKIPNNLNNDPLLTNSWDPYFGPLTVSFYDPTQAYAAGEVVYIAPGDGTYSVFLSMISSNSVDPSLPNAWNSLTIYSQNQVVQIFPNWAVGTTYSQGQTVQFTDGNVYASLTNGNIGNTPSTSIANWVIVPELILMSQQVPKTTIVQPPINSPVIEWSVGTTYILGAFVMFDDVEYVSIVNNNIGNVPNAVGSTSWAPLSLGTLYMSLTNLNINNNPANAPALWAVGTTYAAGNKVGGSDGVIYSSIGSGNVGHDPTISPTFWTNTGVLNPWTTVFTQGGGNDQWMQIGGESFPSGVELTTLNIVYPAGTGPSSQTFSRNIYKLPAGFFRIAPQNPKGDATPLGGPSGFVYNDWNIENGYIVTSESAPIVLRFIANITDVRRMDALFCEGLGARIGIEVCETVTQSTSKLQTIASQYQKFMGDARTINAIEAGYDDPPDDDFVTVRA